MDEDLFAYRTSQQASTKYTPFFLMHGREARSPLILKYQLRETLMPTLSVGDKVKHLVEMRENAHLTALENIEKAQQKQKEQYVILEQQ